MYVAQVAGLEDEEAPLEERRLPVERALKHLLIAPLGLVRLELVQTLCGVGVGDRREPCRHAAKGKSVPIIACFQAAIDVGNFGVGGDTGGSQVEAHELCGWAWVKGTRPTP